MGIVNIGGDHPEEACGVFGIYAPGMNVRRYIHHALYALQHRGQESAGIAVSDGQEIRVKKGMGLVSEVFHNLGALRTLKGHLGIGHVRYSTTNTDVGKSENAQPIVVRYRQGKLAVAHNGNLINACKLRQFLERDGSIFQTTTDSELIAHLIARSDHKDLGVSIKKVLPKVKGAYVFLFMIRDKLIGVRDPYGIRPLSLGRINGGQYVLSSETCAFDTIDADFIRDVEPGEMVVIDKAGLTSEKIMESPKKALCIFEFIYFARPDSNLHGQNVHQARRQLGRKLAYEHPIDADIVTGVPDSSIAAASGYAEEIGLPYELALVKNRYIGRTFIQPTQEKRSLGVRLKLNPIKKIIENKRIIIVDDSIIRGTTSLQLADMLRKAGAKEIHLRISSPPVKAPCYYGINTSSNSDELIASENSVAEIARIIGVDSLAYLGIQSTQDAINLPHDSFCTACFDGNYPIPSEGRESDD